MAVDIKQLRIGSHVEFDGGIVEVLSLSKVGDVGFVKGLTYYYAHPNNLTPIEITPELLVELGFERGSDERKWHKEIDETWIGINLFLDRERMRVYVYDDGVDYGNMIVRYLHELEAFIYITLGKELIEE